MDKLTHTASELDSAIRKFNSEFADCSNTTITEDDALEGTRFIDVNGDMVEGTLGEADIDVSVTMQSDYLGNNETDYPVSVRTIFNVDQEGLVDNVSNGSTITRYINVQEKSVTPASVKQVITPTTGKLLSRVTVAPASIQGGLKKVPIHKFVFGAINSYSFSYNYKGCQMTSGQTHRNIYCYSDIDESKQKVYIIPIGSTIGSSNEITLYDPVRKDLPSNTIVLSPGDSVTSVGNTYAPAGVLTFNNDLYLTFQLTGTFNLYPTMYVPFLLYFNNMYYSVFIDQNYWAHNYNGVGTLKSSGSGFDANNGQYYTNSGVSVDYSAPKVKISAMTQIVFYYYYHTDSSYEKPRMTFGNGESITFLVEDEENGENN